MKRLRFIFSDQLSETILSLRNITKDDTIFLCEVSEEATQVKHHPKKLAFLFASMRHFAAELKTQGYHVHYVKITDHDNTGSLSGEIKRAVRELKVQKIILTEPSEYRLKVLVEKLQKSLEIPIEVLRDNRFFCSKDEFKKWAHGKKHFRMEYFYREMRKKYQILIEPDGTPTGGKWNYDKENRKSPTEELTTPGRKSHKKSAILKEVLKSVGEKFSDHFGNLEPFHYAVTRKQALIELHDFITRLLPYYGDYQDAMKKGEVYLYHSLLSTYLNVGLLLPLEICKLAEEAYKKNKAPLNATEGFIRQILGWREYIRGIYWLKMPEYAELNYFEAKTPLPHFYWDAKTKMTCIAEAVSHSRDHAYSHHIQRLMITGNFALISGLDVKQVQDWYLAVYSDAFEWVEMPNTLGMALFGDGGIVSSKPYAASSNYINKMSNFCDHCYYNPKEMTTEKACPFNALYWDFMIRNRDKLDKNQRLPFVYSTWDKFDEEKQKAIRNKAARSLLCMKNHEI
ncbi:cryptochrome/photolyase family protein [Silvanigrella aquatica]|uniref:Cryptochrome/photolyase family protein n=1 Tax=Silvanigrella aquatica TaxID=1915309 RepID=A0A1L4D0C9_9BACT|nr:cryptochrome/photolyase family protein [Silvanigrella aquatica]APJ03663.1 cryptochrome/photolyase family protein [Silvanigrella aquatica]